MAISLINNFKSNLFKNIFNCFIKTISLNPRIENRIRFVSFDANSSKSSVKSIIESKLNSNLKFTNCLNVRHLTTKVETNTEKPKTLKKVCVLGSGAWGTAVVDLIGHNVSRNKHLFEEEVIFYVRDENLRLIIEKTHQNIRYLSSIILPKNVKPVSSLSEAVSKTDILLFVIPHQYISNVCTDIKENASTLPNAIAISLSKGLHIDCDKNLELSTQIIRKMLGIEVGVLSGANIAIEVARRRYSEATLVNPLTDNKECEELLRSLFESQYFKVTFCTDGPTVEMCGALKNVVAIGCGLIDGLGYGINTKATAISCGFKEIIRFVKLFHPNVQLRTFFENCGIADTIASSFGGRNRKVSEALINSNKSIEVLEKEILGGQKLQGPHTAQVVYKILENKQLLKEFPFFTAIHDICNRNMNPKDIIEAIRSSH